MKRKCEICGQQTDKFLPVNPCFRQEQERFGYGPTEPETLNESEYVCETCQSTDRERMCASFLNKILKEHLIRLNVLEVAPGHVLSEFFSEQYPVCTYKTADLFMEGVDYKVDVQDMEEIRNGQFDMVICFHVLEHVKDDRKALQEFYRILSENGIGIFLVPIDLLQKETEEAWGLSKEENIRRFGQEDHVRKYSRQGFIDRMEDAGFSVLSLDTKWFGWRNCRQNAYSKTATLYIAVKNPAYGKQNLKDVFAGHFFSYASEKADSQSVRYSIDGVEKKGEACSVWGWIFHKSCKYGRIIKGVLCLKKCSRVIYRKQFEFTKRQDVMRIYGEQYEYSGIEVAFPLRRIKKGTYEMAFLLFNDRKAYEVDVKKSISV